MIADSSKAVTAIRPPVPVELLSFGLPSILRAIAPTRIRAGWPPSPDGGVIADHAGDVADPAEVAARLAATPGVVDHGLFPASMVSDVLVARGADVEHRAIG